MSSCAWKCPRCVSGTSRLDQLDRRRWGGSRTIPVLALLEEQWVKEGIIYRDESTVEDVGRMVASLFTTPVRIDSIVIEPPGGDRGDPCLGGPGSSGSERLAVVSRRPWRSEATPQWSTTSDTMSPSPSLWPRPVDSPRQVAEKADVVLIAVVSAEQARDVLSGRGRRVRRGTRSG